MSEVFTALIWDLITTLCMPFICSDPKLCGHWYEVRSPLLSVLESRVCLYVLSIFESCYLLLPNVERSLYLMTSYEVSKADIMAKYQHQMSTSCYLYFFKFFPFGFFVVLDEST